MTAKEKIKEYVKSNFNDPTSYENIEYSNLINYVDSEKIYRSADYITDSIQLSILMEENNKVDPNYNANSVELQNELKRLETERIALSKEYYGKLYQMSDKFRAKNAIGALTVATNTFVFDTLFNIKKFVTE